MLLATTVLASCGNSAEAAATVNGVDLADSVFKEELEVLTAHPEFAQAAFGAPVPPDEGGTVDIEFAAGILSIRITIELLDQEFRARGLELTDADIEAVDETFTDALRELMDDLPGSYRDSFYRWNAQLVALRDALEAEAAERPDTTADSEVQAFYDDFGVIFGEQVCARHILLDSEEAADEVVADLAGGADFGELASERSTDPSAQFNGGDLGCAPRGRYVPGFEEAAWDGPIGEVQGPVESQFGFHVVFVDSRGVAPLAEVEAEIRDFLGSPDSRSGQVLIGLTLQRLVRSATIEVNERYGRWDAQATTVVPPGDESSRTAGR
jgi:hypothetical protein